MPQQGYALYPSSPCILIWPQQCISIQWFHFAYDAQVLYEVTIIQSNTQDNLDFYQAIYTSQNMQKKGKGKTLPW